MRQQPLTATLSPRERSEAKGTPESVSPAPPREGVREATLAVDSTMPVNIGVTGHGRRRGSTGIGGGVGCLGGQGGFLHRGEWMRLRALQGNRRQLDRALRGEEGGERRRGLTGIGGRFARRGVAEAARERGNWTDLFTKLPGKVGDGLRREERTLGDGVGTALGWGEARAVPLDRPLRALRGGWPCLRVGSAADRGPQLDRPLRGARGVRISQSERTSCGLKPGDTSSRHARVVIT